MIDLETLATGPAAAIIAIGACKFDPQALKNVAPAADSVELNRFYSCIDPVSSQQAGLHIDAATILWWMGEARNAPREAWLAEAKVDLRTALMGFAEWYGPESLPTWGNGAGFDNIIMETAYKVCGMPRPWNYRHDRCYRTVRSLASANYDLDQAIIEMRPKTDHNALDDATYQTQALLVMAGSLGLELT
jgi:exodeoxyribonuclease VIII